MSKFLNTNIKLKVTIGFGVGLFILVGVQYMYHKTIKEVLTCQQELLNSSKLSTKIESIKSSLVFFDSKLWSYALTGNNSALIENEVGITRVVREFKSLRSDLSLNENQRVLVEKLAVLLNSEIAHAKEVLFQNELSSANAISLLKTMRGVKLITEIIKNCDQLHAIEEEKFKEIISRNDRLSRKAVQIDVLAYVLAILLIGFSTWILLRDITKREKLEKELRIAKGKAEDANIVKEQFMANMSHEIRTPMNAIIGFIHRLNKTNLDVLQQAYVSAAEKAGANLLTIINDILDFSKIQAGKVSLEKIQFNLRDLLDSIVIMFFEKAKDKNIHLALHVSENIPELIEGDPRRLTQILINLVGNSLKFTEEGRIDIHVLPVLQEGRNITIQFSIKDTGIGIPKDKIGDIFERFTQAASHISRLFGGTGLGLSIVKELVQLQDGTISVESVQGRGTNFTFVIPYETSMVAQPEDKITVDTTIPQEIRDKINILVVEDNLLNQKLTDFMLTDWQLKHEICSNGKLAIEKLQKNAYDIILMDLQMPEMNGYETTEHIRKQLKLEIPIIAMTAHVMPGEKEKCLHFGMTDYISKPINEDELFSLLIRYLFLFSENEKI